MELSRITWESKCSKEKLPLSCTLDGAVVDDTGNDSSGEDTIGEGDLSDRSIYGVQGPD